jgi:hypothetical protein
MWNLLRQKINYIILGILFSPLSLLAQLREGLNKPEHDDKPFHYGIILGTNRSHFSITHHPYFFTQQVNILSIESINSSGFSLGVLLSKRLGGHFNIRTTIFNLIFEQRTFEYRLKYPDILGGEDSITKKGIESTYANFPIQIKFTSDRINNFKVYLLAGVKAEYDLAANSGAKNAENLIKLNRWDYGIEAGIGFHFYLPYFVFMPELKTGWGLGNLHSRDENLKFSNIIDKIYSRNITLSLIVE